MEFNKEEISLCKQVAKKYRKEIKVDNYILWAGRLSLVIEVGKKYIAIKWDKFKEQTKINYRWIELKPYPKLITPLWTISDCLEFLREKGLTFAFYNYDVGKYFFECGYVNKRPWSDIVAYKTPLEACLKAVLAMLEEKSE